MSDSILNKTLWQIVNGTNDNALLEKEVIQYFEDMSSIFGKKKVEVTADDLVMVSTELLPTDGEQLDQMKNKIGSMIYGDKPGFTSPLGENRLSSLFIAITNKENIISKKQKTLEEEIEDFRKKITDLKKEDENYERNHRQYTKEIVMLKHAILLRDKLHGLTDVMRSGRVLTAINALEPVIKDSPDSIKDRLMGDQTIYDRIRSDLLHRRVEKANADLNYIILILVSGLNKELTAICSDVSNMTFLDLENDFKRFANFSTALAAPVGSLETYTVIVDEVANEYKSLVDRIQEAPVSMDTLEYRRLKRIALEEANAQFTSEKYPYQINSPQLRKSGNKYISDQLKYNTYKVADVNKYIIMGKKEDNLFQVKKDAARSLQINGKKVWEVFNMTKEDLLNIKDDDLKEYLVRALGEKNTSHLIRHYDQTIPIMIAGAIDRGVNSGMGTNTPIFIAPASHHTENVYLKDGIVYRDAASDHINIKIVSEHGDSDTWKFKTNIKILSSLSGDGFSVLKIGTDNAFVGNSIIHESSFDNLKKMIDVIQQGAKDLLGKQKKFQDNPKAKYKLDVVETVLKDIALFKKGEITFDELAAKVNEERLKPAPHLGSFGKVRGVITGKKPGFKEVLINFDEQLTAIKKVLETGASKLRVDGELKLNQERTPSPTSPPRTPSPR